MNVRSYLGRFVADVTPSMHKVRRACFQAAIESAMQGGSLSITGLGRHLRSQTHEKHRIKRIDRLCGNDRLHRQTGAIYGHLARRLVGGLSRPVIHVDWSDMDDRQEHFLLRASLAAEGRSLTLYEQLHTVKTKDKPGVHTAFMTRLKEMLPEGTQPIIVTDAGFRIPWFRLVRSLDWDYVGRVRNRTHCQAVGERGPWQPIKALYAQAHHRAKELGLYLLGESVQFETRLVIVRRRAKGRRDKINNGARARRGKPSRASAKREREPWLLATSLPAESLSPQRLAKIYATRMQIEESFRDLKSGLGMNRCGSRQKHRLEVLLLLAALVQHLLYLLGLAVKTADLHWTYQSNSIRCRNILSNQFIALRAIQDKRLNLTPHHWKQALQNLRKLTLNPKAAY